MFGLSNYKEQIVKHYMQHVTMVIPSLVMTWHRSFHSTEMLHHPVAELVLCVWMSVCLVEQESQSYSPHFQSTL